MKFKEKLLLSLLSLVLVFTFASCMEANDPNKLKITGITFDGETVTYDGETHTLTVAGELPEGVTVAYQKNEATDAGTYHAVATLSGENYNTLTLKADLVINKATVSGITFGDDTVTYDGTEHALAIVGELPDGVTVAYQSNKATDAGTYHATATLSGKNYETKTLNADLIINKATITGVTAANAEISYDGETHLPTLSGNIPAGVTMTVLSDETDVSGGIKAIGTHTVTYTLSGKNYETLTLTATLKIKLNALALASAAIEKFGSVPDVWSFLPESFGAENRVTNIETLGEDFVSVSAIPKNGMGKQLAVVYSVMNTATTALSYVNTVYGGLNTVKSLYTDFLDKSPADEKHFSGEAGVFSFSLTLDDDEYILSAAISGVSVTVFACLSDESYGAIIHLADNTVLKYTVSEDHLLIAADILDVSATEIEFIRDAKGHVVGNIYEHLVVAGHELTSTSAFLEVGDTYTTLIGNKGDFIPTSGGTNCEIYRNSDGQLVGTEVREVIKSVQFNTLWFPLFKVNGINTIKKEDTLNGSNPDTIYINGAESPIQTKLVGGLSLKTASRRFDIEYKKMTFFQVDEAGDYKKIEIEVPMMFIQEENLSTFASDFSDKNASCLSGSVSLSVQNADTAAVSYAYNTLLPIYDKMKALVTYDAIVEFCTGKKPE